MINIKLILSRVVLRLFCFHLLWDCERLRVKLLLGQWLAACSVFLNLSAFRTSASCMKVIPGQWIVTRARLGNPARVTPYVPVTGYNFIHQVRLKAPVKNFENLVQNWGTCRPPNPLAILGACRPQAPCKQGVCRPQTLCNSEVT